MTVTDAEESPGTPTATLPDEYQAALIEPGQVSLVRLPVVPPGPGEVLVRIAACAICTWEMRAYTGAESTALPFLGGHEIAGVVAATGPVSIPVVEVGDRVAVRRLGRCGRCRGCVEHGMCESAHLGVVNTGTMAGPQGLAEYLTVPAHQAVPVGPAVPMAAAALVEPVSCVLRSVHRSRVRIGDDVLVMGAGFMGVLHARVARLSGARVFMAEPQPGRRAAATREAHTLLDPSGPDAVSAVRAATGGGPAAVFVCTGDVAAVEFALRVVAPRGRVVMFASTHPAKEVSVSVNLVHHHEVEFVGAVAQSDDEFRVAAKLLSSGLLDVSDLVTNVFPASRLRDAFEVAVVGTGYRTVVEWGDGDV